MGNVSKPKMTLDEGMRSGFVKDSFTNILKGIGRQGIDASKSTGVGMPRILHEAELVALYAGDGLASRIINVVADDMIRNGWEIPADNDGKLYMEQQRLGVKKQLADALRWARLFGGSLVVVETQGGGSLESPLVPYSGKRAKVKKLRVYPKDRVVLDWNRVSSSMSSNFYDDFEYFTVNKRYGGQFRVHASRCLVFKGLPNPQSNYSIIAKGGDAGSDYWGISVLQPIWDHLASLGLCLQTAGTLATEFSVGKYKLKDLDAILAENDSSAIMKRITNMQASKSVLNAILIGEGDEYTRDTLSFQGLPEMIDRLFMVVSGISAIPVTRLFGRSAAGQNATGEEDSRNYYDAIEAAQEFELLDNLMKLLMLIDSGMASPLGEENISVEFNPVWAPSELQMVEMKARQAAADQIYLDSGVVTPDEVRRMRFSGGYAFEQSLENTEEGSAPGVPLQEAPPSPLGGRKRSKPKAKVAPLPEKARKK